ncbi:hypothetical protein [Haloferula sp. A504]|uniref:hypothetical protein n=1 Tax=Haloferula sp. A504 TaxID=3373601 RepID=UPI0031C723A0|nr:hypothetical protein [Verrucomicrobiaceae bacterium E54]
MNKLQTTFNMETNNGNQKKGARAHNGAWLEAVLNRMRFGTVTFQVLDGRIMDDPKPKLRHSGKPGGRGSPPARDLKGRYCGSRPDAVGDFLAEVATLSGTWEMTLKVTDRVPIHWEYEELEAPANTKH